MEGEYGAQSVRWDRKNQDLLSCLEHVCLIWIRSANSHTGQQPELRKQAGQMTPLSNRAVERLLHYVFMVAVGATTPMPNRP